MVKEFYIKDILARTGFGFVIGMCLATYFYGIGPATKAQ
jgi:hypothetical protein